MTDNKQIDEVTPESLMNTFHGPGFSKMIIITIVVHAVVILGTSVPFLLKSVIGDDTEKLTKEERAQKAVEDATAPLQKIADEYGLTLQEVREQISKGETRKTTSKSAAAENREAPATTEKQVTPEPEIPKSAIEQELEKKAAGPALPDVSTDIEEEEEDLFK
jgi:hypothetical protein